MDDLFAKALQFLYERNLEKMGFQADFIVTKKPEMKNEKEKVS